MTREEKQLLIIDLCARLPYGVEIICETSTISLTLSAHMLGEIIKDGNELQWKPYLRSMSSMTEEEREEYRKFVEHRKILYDNGSYDGARNILRLDIPNRLSDFTDWLNSHHFDYRGLIPMGLALEAPKGMYKTE